MDAGRADAWRRRRPHGDRPLGGCPRRGWRVSWEVLALRYGTLASTKAGLYFNWQVYGEPDAPQELAHGPDRLPAPGPSGRREQPLPSRAQRGGLGGPASTTGDMQKVAEMLRGEGAIAGTRVLSPRTVQVARRNWTGNMENELYATVARRAGWEVPPAYMGLGFNVRGARLVHHQFGTLTSPETMGNYGAGSCVYWVDPELDMTFVSLTAGLL